MPLNKQQRWQQKKAAAGLCVKCGAGKPEAGAKQCPPCLAKDRRRTCRGGWREGGPGAPPLAVREALRQQRQQRASETRRRENTRKLASKKRHRARTCLLKEGAIIPVRSWRPRRGGQYFIYLPDGQRLVHPEPPLPVARAAAIQQARQRILSRASQ